jgi:hypothetical protein
VELTDRYVTGQFALDETSLYAIDSYSTPMVFSRSLNGGPYTVLAEGPSISARQLAVNSTHVFWTEDNVKGISRVSKAGGTPKTVASTSAGDPEAIKVNETHVYWSDMADGTIKRAPVEGGDPETIAPALGSEAIAINDTTVCWTQWDGQGAIGCVPIAGGTVWTPATDQPFVLAVALSADTVYWTVDGAVMSAPLATGVQKTWWTGTGTPRGVAVDDTHVYWSVDYENLILKAPLAGGPTETVTTATGNLYQVEVDGTSLYWASQSYVARITPK